jgi:hypothetical protein
MWNLAWLSLHTWHWKKKLESQRKVAHWVENWGKSLDNFSCRLPNQSPPKPHFKLISYSLYLIIMMFSRTAKTELESCLWLTSWGFCEISSPFLDFTILICKMKLLILPDPQGCFNHMIWYTLKTKIFDLNYLAQLSLPLLGFQTHL